MKRWIALSLGLLVALCLSLPAQEQQARQAKGKAAKAAQVKEDRLSGRIQMINKDASTLTIARGNVKRTVVYTPGTKITYLNKPSTMDEVKEGRRVIVLGKFNDKTQLVASRIEIRGN